MKLWDMSVLALAKILSPKLRYGAKHSHSVLVASTTTPTVMRQPAHNTLRLPRQLRDQLGVFESNSNGSRKRRSGPANRKEQRKAARVQKKSSHASAHTARTIRKRPEIDYEEDQLQAPIVVTHSQTKATSVQPQAVKSILKVPKSTISIREAPEDGRFSVSPPPTKVSRNVRDTIAADDAEIAALEKALGVKGKEKPKSFEDDGLDDLLDGIDEAVGLTLSKRKRREGEEWLKDKRRKTQEYITATEYPGSSGSSGGENSIEEAGSGELDQDDGEFSSGSYQGDVTSFDDEQDHPSITISAKKTRENPYVAPVSGSSTTIEGKYVPPSLRTKELGGAEDLSQLRRQIQGLLNRLSEKNLRSVLNDIEKLYLVNPRQHVSTTLLDLLMGLLSDSTSLQDTFIILYAGFLTAVFKVIGSDFGAQAIEKIHGEILQHYHADVNQKTTSKRVHNLISLLAELYNFQVISSKLIYDFVQLFLEQISEINTELLLKIVRNAGPQLRQDDPSSLKDIVLQLQQAVATVGEESLSVRTKFMIETMNNLKNNRMKTGIAASAITSEHTIRMKKTLGSLNQRNIRASEPLRIGLKDLRATDKRGKWWLVGASYKDEIANHDEQEERLSTTRRERGNDLAMKDVSNDLAQLAKEQRMNTDVRRSIFIAVMSSTDFNDAYVRLMKLGLKKSQELEIPKVLIHCAGAEKVYNPFYTFLSRRWCSDKKLKMAFQFSLWDLFKRIGEGEDDFEEDQEAREGQLGLRSILNLARMFGVLVAEGGLGLGILKVCLLAREDAPS